MTSFFCACVSCFWHSYHLETSHISGELQIDRLLCSLISPLGHLPPEPGSQQTQCGAGKFRPATVAREYTQFDRSFFREHSCLSDIRVSLPVQPVIVSLWLIGGNTQTCRLSREEIRYMMRMEGVEPSRSRLSFLCLCQIGLHPRSSINRGGGSRTHTEQGLNLLSLPDWTTSPVHIYGRRGI